MILAIVEDLMFRSTLEAAAAHLGAALTVSKDAAPALRPGSAWTRVLIDLNLEQADPLDAIQAIRAAHPEMPVIGYYSHVQLELQRQAIQAGCTAAMPRSAFIRQLPELLK